VPIFGPPNRGEVLQGMIKERENNRQDACGLDRQTEYRTLVRVAIELI
jgi:hypothetical protein